MQEMQDTHVRYLGWEAALEYEMATHSRILAWKIPRTEEPGGLQSGVTKSRTCLSTHMPCQKMNVHVSVIFVSQRYAFVGVCGGPYSLLSSFRV